MTILEHNMQVDIRSSDIQINLYADDGWFIEKRLKDNLLWLYMEFITPILPNCFRNNTLTIGHDKCTVYMQGSIHLGNIKCKQETVLFRLPRRYAPPRRVVQLVNNNGVSRIDITANGEVLLMFPHKDIKRVNFDGIQYPRRNIDCQPLDFKKWLS